MIKSRYIVGATLLAISTVAAAGAFDGPSVQLGVSVNATHTSLKDYSPDGKVADTNAVGNLSLNYNKTYGDFNLGGGVFAMLGSQKAGSLNSFADNTGGVWSDSWKLKNVWGVSIEPGYYVNKSVLAYAKVSYVQATGTNTFDYTQAIPNADAGAASHKHQGLGLGGGVKFMITNDVYGAVEIEQISFNRKDYWNDPAYPETYKPGILKAGVSIGYKF